MTGRSNIHSASLYAIVLIMTGMVYLFYSFYQHREIPKVFEWDTLDYYAYLPALFIQGDISLQSIDADTPAREYYWFGETDEGRRYIKMSCGMSIIYLPYFTAGHIWALNSSHEAHGFSDPYRYTLMISGLFSLLGGLIFMRKFLFLFLKNEWAISLALVTVAFGTNLVYYTIGESTFSHVHNLFVISVFLYFSFSWMKKGKNFHVALAGAAFGLLVVMRPVNILFLLFPLLYFLWHQGKMNRKNLLATGLFVLSALPFALLQVTYWKIATGDFIYYSYGNEGFFFSDPRIFEGWFSFRKGWLIYSPVMLLSLLGFIPLFRRKPKLGGSLLIFFLFFNYVTFSWWCWWYGGGFGARTMIDAYGALSLPLALSFDSILGWWKKGNRYKIAVVLVFALWGFLIRTSVFQNEQYSYRIIHHDAMSREAYKQIFWKRDGKPLGEEYEEALNHPDSEAAREGRNR